MRRRKCQQHHLPRASSNQAAAPGSCARALHAWRAGTNPSCRCCCRLRSFPLQNTHNGDQIEVEGSAYVVQSVIMQYKLVRGRYK